MADRFLTAAVLGLLVAVASFAFRFLTIGGAAATFGLAVIIYGIGGWQWTIPIFTFFVLSSLLSKLGRDRKKQFAPVFEKSGTRDAGQVLANGGVAALITLLAGFFPVFEFYPIYLGALAAVTADTWGTEIGVLAKGRTVAVLALKPVAAGTSGGVSGLGLFGGALGALVIAVSGYAWYTDMRTAAIIVIAGVVGSLVDSLLGATMQVQYKCVRCGTTTERRMHCGYPAAPSAGIDWIGNDAVNWACGLTGAAVVWGLTLLS